MTANPSEPGRAPSPSSDPAPGSAPGSAPGPKAALLHRLRRFVDRERELTRARREVDALTADNEHLQRQLTRLRAAMRHCTTCEYRIAAREGTAPTRPG
jgi:hypothetical protein